MFFERQILGLLLVYAAYHTAYQSSSKEVNTDNLVMITALTVTGLFLLSGPNKQVIVAGLLIAAFLHFGMKNERLPTQRTGLTELLKYGWEKRGTDCGDTILKIIQINFKCCGINGPQDYEVLPKSCCHNEICNSHENVFGKGCFETISALRIREN